MDWLSHIDPNVALSLIGGAALWLYHSIRGDRAESLSDLIDGAGRAVWTAVLASWSDGSIAEFQAKVRTAVEAKIWAVAADHGFAKNTTTELVVRTAVEHLVADATEALYNAMNARIARQLDAIGKTIDRTSATLDKAAT